MTMYPRYADTYNQATAMFDWLRRRAVERLELRPGSTVIDIGCGSGRCFRYLQAAIGPTGRLIAVDECASMLEQSETAADRHGWCNVTPVCERAEDLSLPDLADAVLFCAVHDVMRSPDAIKNVLAQVRPGGRVVATGGKWPSVWLWPLHLTVAAIHTPYVTTLEDFDRPWRLLGEHCPDLRVEDVALGTGYLATGSLPGG